MGIFRLDTWIQNSVKRQLMVLLLIPLLFFIMAVAYFEYDEWDKRLETNAIAETVRGSLTIAVGIKEDMLDQDAAATQQLINQIIASEHSHNNGALLDMQSIAIVDAKGMLLAHSGDEKPKQREPYHGPLPRGERDSAVLVQRYVKAFAEIDSSKNRLLAYAPIEDRNQRIGGVITEYSLEPLYRQQRQVISLFLIRSLGAVVIAVVLGLLIVRRISQPLLLTMKALPQLGSGKFSLPPLTRRDDEYRTLTNALKKVDKRIHKSNFALQKEIEERRQMERELKLAASVFENGSEGIVITDRDNNILSVNSAFERLTGYRQDEVIGKNPRVLKSGRHSEEFYRNMWSHILEDGRWQGEIWEQRKDGSIYPKWITINAIRNDLGEITNFMAIFSDISARKAAEERIHHLAHHDALTGLANRILLADRIRQTIHKARRTGHMVAVLFLDLDGFKLINDTLGHEVGDSMLCSVAERLKSLVRDSDTVARMGGDEFLVLLSDISHEEDAARVAEKIVDTIGEPYLINGQELRTSPSIGISIYPQDAADENILIRCADTAMYHAKAAGRNNFQFYTGSMHEQVLHRLELEHGLRLAVENGGFELEFQPQYDVVRERITGFEALVRWQHCERGNIPPATFIPIAEECGVIIPLGEIVLRRACLQALAWQQAGLSQFRVAVNVSARQFWGSSFASRVGEILRETGAQAEWLELELTESTLLHHRIEKEKELHELRNMGIKIAIDDFGTGYSSLSYLKRLAIDRLKIDQSFVRELGHDSESEAIVIAIIKLAQTLNIELVAEGVETVEAHDFLVAHGCHVMQGFLLGRPQKAEAWNKLPGKNLIPR
jgi:diguanylate cyclase (GGDEF)-like protein/PAS domain S-box-containing protein